MVLRWRGFHGGGEPRVCREHLAQGVGHHGDVATQSPLGGGCRTSAETRSTMWPTSSSRDADVAVEPRGAAHPDGSREGAHRHGGQAFAVGHVDRGGAMPVDRQRRRRARS